jgi:hypothetical protein
MVDKSGDAAIAKSIAAIRDKKPADGAALDKARAGRERLGRDTNAGKGS